MESPPLTVDLGAVGPVRFSMVDSSQPWELDVGAIVLSVGEGYGKLAQAVKGAYVAAPWSSVDLSSIRPGRPGSIRLDTARSTSAARWAVLATLHAEPSQVPSQRVALATIEVAGRAVKDQPYQARPFRARTAVGRAAATAIASNAMRLISPTMPRVEARNGRARIPSVTPRT